MVTQCENKLYTHIYTSLSVLIHARKHAKLNASCLWRWGYGSRFGLEVGPCSVPREASPLGLGVPARRPLNPAVRPWSGAVGQDRAKEEERKENSPLSQA